jgi:hypothetical protein
MISSLKAACLGASLVLVACGGSNTDSQITSTVGGATNGGGSGASTVGGAGTSAGGSSTGGASAAGSSAQGGAPSTAGSSGVSGATSGGGSSGMSGAAGATNGGASGASSAVLTEAPHCDSGMLGQWLAVGSVGSVTINEMPTPGSAFLGYSQGSAPEFNDPSSGTLPSTRIGLDFTWANSLPFGDTAPITGGTLTLPVAQGGQAYCIAQGEVGFVNGGAEDEVFKFAITAAVPGASCTGTPVSIDLRGCLR